MPNKKIKICVNCECTDEHPLGNNHLGKPFLCCCPEPNYIPIASHAYSIREIKKIPKDVKSIPLPNNF